MTIPLPAPLPPAVRKWLGVMVDLGDADAGQLGSARAVYELLYGLCCEVYRGRLPRAPVGAYFTADECNFLRGLASTQPQSPEDMSMPDTLMAIAAKMERLPSGDAPPQEPSDETSPDCVAVFSGRMGSEVGSAAADACVYASVNDGLTYYEVNGSRVRVLNYHTPARLMVDWRRQFEADAARLTAASRPPGGAEPGLREAVLALADEIDLTGENELGISDDEMVDRLRALASEGAAPPPPTTERECPACGRTQVGELG